MPRRGGERRETVRNGVKRLHNEKLLGRLECEELATFQYLSLSIRKVNYVAQVT